MCRLDRYHGGDCGGTAVTYMKENSTLDWESNSGNTGFEMVGKYTVVKTSGVDKVVHGKSRKLAGKRADDSCEQHPHLRGGQKQRHMQRSWRRIGWTENMVSPRPMEECFKV